MRTTVIERATPDKIEKILVPIVSVFCQKISGLCLYIPIKNPATTIKTIKNKSLSMEK